MINSIALIYIYDQFPNLRSHAQVPFSVPLHWESPHRIESSLAGAGVGGVGLEHAFRVRGSCVGWQGEIIPAGLASPRHAVTSVIALHVEGPR